MNLLEMATKFKVPRMDTLQSVKCMLQNLNKTFRLVYVLLRVLYA